MRWLILILLIALVALVVTASAESVDRSDAGTTSICVDIKLPEKGKCVNFTYSGYTAEICFP